MNPIEPGRVVIPRAGRDKGRPMIVLSTQGEYAYVADGALRSAQNPKKKKHKHLLPQKELVYNIVESIKNGMCILDADLRKALERTNTSQGGVNACQKMM